MSYVHKIRDLCPENHWRNLYGWEINFTDYPINAYIVKTHFDMLYMPRVIVYTAGKLLLASGSYKNK